MKTAKTREGITPRGQTTWLVRVFMGRDASGKTQYHNHTVHGTRKDAVRYRDRIRSELSTGTFVEPSRQSLGEFLAKWLETSVKPRVRAKTFEDYQSHVTRHLTPALGTRRLSQLQPAEIQKLYNSLSERLSPRTVRYVHSTLYSALQQAVKWGELARNPAEHVSLPKARKREMKVLDGTQMRAFTEAVRGTRYEALWLVLATSGMRPCEALGLKWADRDGNRLLVQRSLARSKQGWAFESTKTEKSSRSIPIPESTLRALDQLRREQAVAKLAAGPKYQNHDLVFASQTGEPLDWRVVVRRYFKPLIRSTSLPEIRPYDLRHSHATLLLQAGVHPKVVSERLGHSTTSMTMDVYSHVLPDMQQAAARVVEEMLFDSTAAVKMG